MKLMRSRFRLISLMLTCVFLLTAVICVASVLKQAGISLPSARRLLSPTDSPSPEPPPAEEETTPALPESTGDGNLTEEATIQPDSEYNIFGL